MYLWKKWFNEYIYFINAVIWDVLSFLFFLNHFLTVFFSVAVWRLEKCSLSGPTSFSFLHFSFPPFTRTMKPEYVHQCLPCLASQGKIPQDFFFDYS